MYILHGNVILIFILKPTFSVTLRFSRPQHSSVTGVWRLHPSGLLRPVFLHINLALVGSLSAGGPSFPTEGRGSWRLPDGF